MDTNTPERRLWQSVLAIAGEDARKDSEDGELHGAEWHYGWSQRSACRRVCEYADVDWDCVKAGFKRIYEDNK